MLSPSDSLQQTSLKQAFVNHIREWLNLDTESKVLWKKHRDMCEQKRILCDKMHEYADATGMKQTRIDINDGSLRFVDKTEYGALSMKYIESCLAKFMEDDDVNTIMTYIRDNRTSRLVNDIKRTIHNEPEDNECDE